MAPAGGHQTSQYLIVQIKTTSGLHIGAVNSGTKGKKALVSAAGGQMNCCSFYLGPDLALLLLNLLKSCWHLKLELDGA